MKEQVIIRHDNELLLRLQTLQACSYTPFQVLLRLDQKQEYPELDNACFTLDAREVALWDTDRRIQTLEMLCVYLGQRFHPNTFRGLIDNDSEDALLHEVRHFQKIMELRPETQSHVVPIDFVLQKNYRRKTVQYSILIATSQPAVSIPFSHEEKFQIVVAPEFISSGDVFHAVGLAREMIADGSLTLENISKIDDLFIGKRKSDINDKVIPFNLDEFHRFIFS